MNNFIKYYHILKKSINLFKNSLTSFSSTSSITPGDITYGWVNSTCQYNFNENFKYHGSTNENQVGVVVFLPLYRRYSTFSLSEPTTESLVSFFYSILQMKVPLERYVSSQVSLKSIYNCLIFDSENPQYEVVVTEEDDSSAFTSLIKYYKLKRVEFSVEYDLEVDYFSETG